MHKRFWGTFGAWSPAPTLWLRPDYFEFRVPCQHDAFSFNVAVREAWARPGRQEDLESTITACKDAHRTALRRRLRAISRTYAPDKSADLEREANEKLGRQQLFTDDEGLSCTCTFEIAPDEALAEALQDAARARLTAEANHVAAARSLQVLKQFEQDWLAFLRRLGRDPLAPAIAKLAGSSELAEAIVRYAEQQERTTNDLRDLCGSATKAYNETGLYEFQAATNSAFSQLLQHITQEGASGVNGSRQNGHRPTP